MTWSGSRPVREAPAYVDTPGGIVSADGTRFHTTERLLREYADTCTRFGSDISDLAPYIVRRPRA